LDHGPNALRCKPVTAHDEVNNRIRHHFLDGWLTMEPRLRLVQQFPLQR